MSLDPTPLLDTARDGRPWHQLEGCTACDRSTRGGLERATGCVTPEQIGAALGVTRDAVQAWRSGRNRIRDIDADLYADRLRTPAWVIWPELADAAVEQVTAVCASTDCPETFVVTDPKRLYCSKRCANRESYRRNRERRLAQLRERYATDPEWRDQRVRYQRHRRRDGSTRAERAQNARWRDANREYLRAYGRAYRARKATERSAA